MAKKLNVGQDKVSRVEKRTDRLPSTLSGYMETMCGELNLVAEFLDHPALRPQIAGAISKARGAGAAQGGESQAGMTV